MPQCDLERAFFPEQVSGPMFSFLYDGAPGEDRLNVWERRTAREDLEDGRTKATTVWTDRETGLRVVREVIRFGDFPAIESLIHVENVGENDTPVVSDVLALDLTIAAPLAEKFDPYRLHHTVGAPSNPTDFAAAAKTLTRWDTRVAMSGGGGRSSNRDFPFFKIETGVGSFVVAVGWSGQWAARVEYGEDKALRITAGLETTHFRLHPGERVRMPRILVLYSEGDTRRANALFRRLIHEHYAAKRNGIVPDPIFFCNTCFTRGGGWLNECNAENQISLIEAFEPLGVEAVITDAGWFEGGWPDGAGNWTPRKDAYPDGMGPVAAAAEERGMVYGLWFEPERVAAGTWVARNHPDWLLSSESAPTLNGKVTYLLNFGLREVQDYFFTIVKGFMELPGFRVYRQDLNIDPLPYWRENEAEDRKGIVEITYVEGLYVYWERIAQAWPDCLMEECAGGGRRIDLETVVRMHIHQKTDYWFDDDVDQASIWGLSQYLPNSVFVAHLNNLSTYSFHSTMASSLCIGWIADADDFDRETARKHAQTYRSVRHLFTGEWYPLLSYSRDPMDWSASQYHRPDLDEGIVLVFRREQSPYPIAELALVGLRPEQLYDLHHKGNGRRARLTGSELMACYAVKLPERRSSDLIRYRVAR